MKKTPSAQGAKQLSAPTNGALKLKEARAYLGGISIPTMHRLIARGELKPCRKLRHLLFAKSDLDRWLSS